VGSSPIVSTQCDQGILGIPTPCLHTEIHHLCTIRKPSASEKAAGAEDRLFPHTLPDDLDSTMRPRPISKPSHNEALPGWVCQCSVGSSWCLWPLIPASRDRYQQIENHDAHSKRNTTTQYATPPSF